jgi:transposase
MSYRIAGIDVHKKMLAVVVSNVEVESEFQFERRMFGGNPEQLRLLAAWLLEQEAEEVVMESTAQYWKPVWGALERYWKPIREKREGAKRRSGTLHLAQAQSNRGRRGRKRDFPDAERLVKRLVARELTLSFVPDAEQRLWRAVTRKKYQLRRDLVRLHNQLESLLEEAHIKLSSLVSDLLGVSARRMLKALADGETNPAALAVLAHERLRATPEQLGDALGACTDLKPVYRRLLKMVLEQLQFLEQQIGQLDQELATLLHPHHVCPVRSHLGEIKPGPQHYVYLIPAQGRSTRIGDRHPAPIEPTGTQPTNRLSLADWSERKECEHTKQGIKASEHVGV